MANKNKQPTANSTLATILVKKADGKEERMTLEQFRKYRASHPTSQTKKPVKAPLPAKPEPAPVVQQPVASPTSSPSTKKEVVQAPIPQKAEVKKVNYEVREAALGRELPKIKKIKSLKTIQKPMVKKSNEIKKKLHPVSPKPKKVLKKVETKKRARTALMTSPVTNLSTTTPVVDIFVDEAAAKNEAKGWKKDDHASLLDEKIHKNIAKNKTKELIPEKNNPQNRVDRAVDAPSRPFKQKTVTTGKKPIVQDIVRPTTSTPRQSRQPSQAPKMTVGPVDELRNFSLENFQKLDTVVEKAKEKIIQKFANLKTESFLLYADGILAWRESPLFQDYKNVLKNSLNNRQKIEEAIAANPKGINLEEFLTLVEINKKLAI